MLRKLNHGALDSMEETDYPLSKGLNIINKSPPSATLQQLQCPHRTTNGLMIYLSLILLVPLLSTSTGQDCTPVFIGKEIGPRNPPDVVKILEGSSFTLNCKLSQHHNFDWRLNKSSLFLRDIQKFIVNETELNNGMISTELLVSNISRNNTGEYTCILSGCHSQNQSHHGLTIKVIYAQKPQIYHPTAEYGEIIGDIGENINITCIIKGNDDSLGFSWQKEIKDQGSEEGRSGWYNMEDICKEMNRTEKKPDRLCYIERSHENQTTNLILVIHKLRRDDMGRYSCGTPVENFNRNSLAVEWANNDFINLRVTGNNVRQKRSMTAKQKHKQRFDGISIDPPATFLYNGTDEKVKVVRRFDKGTNSTIGIEGDTVILFCDLVRGQVQPQSVNRYQVMWRIHEKYRNRSFFETIDRYTYNETYNRTEITITPLNMTDKGWYQCALWDTHSCYLFDAAKAGCIVATFEIQLRVKEKMSSLYPFVAICVEVILLFLIILIYEKSKNKTEVEESDTDGSPDQKNVSDNGEGISEATRLAKD